jgi:hypothetical protein
MNDAFLLMLLSLAPPQPSLKQGKPDLKVQIYGEAPLKIQQHVPVNDSSSSFPWKHLPYIDWWRRLGEASISLELSELD